MPGLEINFSSSDISYALDGMFTSEGICGILQETFYTHVDYVFSLVAAFLDRICGERKNMTSVTSTLYIMVVN